MLYVRLTEAQRSELRRVSRQAVGRVALRAHMVLVSDRAYAVPRIAEVHECGEDVVRLWLHRYEQHGVAGLDDEPRSGRPLKDPLARHVVDAQAGQSPERSGHVQACWTVALSTAFPAARFRLVLSCATVRRCLRATGWRWARPRLAPASVLRRKRDPESATKLAAIARAAASAAAGAVHLLYLDECDLQLLPVVRAMWMKGRRVRIPTPGQNAERALFGALDAATGRFHRADYARKLATNFVAFLEQIASAYPTGPVVLVPDNVQMHDATVVRAWLAAHPRVAVLWLPEYAAHDANPAERVWGSMKDAVAANRLAGSIDDPTAAAHRFFDRLAPHPVLLPDPLPIPAQRPLPLRLAA